MNSALNPCDYDQCWQLIQAGFPILNESSSECLETSEKKYNDAVQVISNLNLTKFITTCITDCIEKNLRRNVVVNFWSYYNVPPDTPKADGFKRFCTSVDYLYTNFNRYLPAIDQLNRLAESNYQETIYGEKSNVDSLKLIFHGTLLSQLPVHYETIVENFYQSSLEIEGQENCTDSICTICSKGAECRCDLDFNETNKRLVEMSILEPLVGQVLTSLTYSHIESFIKKTCKDNFECSYINYLETWLDSHVIHWLRKIYCFGSLHEFESNVTNFKQKLVNFLYETYTKIRINQLFNIIIEYPDSLHALQDLNTCLPKTDLKPFLTKKLQKAMETRLLHPGVSTPDILTAYVASIRSMRVLDPTGLLLETVTQPIHQYLRSREDTVRCVVSSLTEEGPNDLAEELVKGKAVCVDENNPDEDAENWETWVPDPVDASPGKGVRRTSDIISMLVNVYGSKELFVNEYRTLLADRLLSQFACDTEKEIRYLELLKLRFGDSQLHYCEVMLKDIVDSKRINQNIKQDPTYTEDIFCMNAMIVSAQFWPAFKDETLQLHDQVQAQMESYTKGFETLKGSRTLSWKNHLGVVDLEVELPDRTLNLSVSPIHATILMHFQDKSEWSIEDLSRVMQVPPTLLRRKMAFWHSHGLIEEHGDVFSLVETTHQGPTSSREILVEDYESESAMASTQDQREEELQTFWSYIVGMLVNLDSLSLERIYQMLKMFAFQGSTIECSSIELRQFLDRKVREHQLVYSGGLYKLPKHDVL